MGIGAVKLENDKKSTIVIFPAVTQVVSESYDFLSSTEHTKNRNFPSQFKKTQKKEHRNANTAVVNLFHPFTLVLDP